MNYFWVILFVFIPELISGDELLHVHALWRHGERNPKILYPESYNNISNFPEGFEQLTKNGVHKFFKFGQHFYSKYVYDLHFLSDKYVKDEIYARSTNVDRSLISAMAFYSGFYSNKSTKEYFLAPVPIHSISPADDFLDIINIDCPRKFQLWSMVDNSEEIQTWLNQSYDLMAEVSNKTKLSLNFYAQMNLFDTAVLETIFGLPVPLWISKRIPGFEKLMVNYSMAALGFIPFKHQSIDLQLELAKISSGALIAEISDRLALKIKCQNTLNATKECSGINTQKFYTYSTHDTTVASLLLGLGFKSFLFNEYSMPDFGSTIVLELWEKEKTRNITKIDEHYYVKIYYYKNYTVENPDDIGRILLECNEKGCPLSYLAKRAELFRPRPDFRTLCHQLVTSDAFRINQVLFTLFISFVPGLLKLL